MIYNDTDTAVINRALQTFGTRTTVTTAEMNALSTNESKQADLIYTSYRDQLLRMAPWNCGVGYRNLVWLTSQPGTPENTSPNTPVWTPGQPPLGWAYEYLYPSDCLRACFLIPAIITGFAGGIPIYPVATNIGTSATAWQGPALKFKVQLDQYFHEAVNTTLISGGSGHTVGDVLILGTDTLGQNFNPAAVPAGVVVIKVTGVDGNGAITTFSLQPLGDSQVSKNAFLFSVPTYNLVQVQTTGLGSGAVVSVTSISPASFSARTILTNQEFATLAYIKQVTDPEVMDEDFIEAWANLLGASLSIPLTGDKQQANMNINLANRKIEEARKTDGNEGLTVNDVTPDFIRIRGVDFHGYANSWNGFDWGEFWPNV